MNNQLEESLERIEQSKVVKVMRPYYALLKKIFTSDHNIEFSKVVRGIYLTELELAEIRALRLDTYKGKQEYLIPKTQEQKKKELYLDQNAYHLYVRSKDTGKLLGALRLLPFPFEIGRIRELNLDTSKYTNFLEISRLVVSKNARGLGIGKKLMMLSGIWVIKSKKSAGFVAICKKEKLDMYSLFGFASKFEFNIEGRGEYYFIRSSFKKMSFTTIKRFLQLFYLKILQSS